MTRRRGTTTSLGALLVLLAATATAGAREACPPSQRLDSLVSVGFERFVETEGDEEEAVVLRFSNQSGCGVVVRVLARPVVVGGGRIRFLGDDEEPADGALAGLDYTEHRPQFTGTVGPPAYGGGCVVDLMTIPAGRSILFRVPASKFRLRYNVAVPFHFAGESGPRHQAFFYWSALPES